VTNNARTSNKKGSLHCINAPHKIGDRQDVTHTIIEDINKTKWFFTIVCNALERKQFFLKKLSNNYRYILIVSG
jgi:hypothetical protein